MKVALNNLEVVSLRELLLSRFSKQISYFAPNVVDEACYLLAATFDAVMTKEGVLTPRPDGQLLVAEADITRVIGDCLDLLCAYSRLASFPDGMARKIADCYRGNAVIGLGGIHTVLPDR